MANVSGTVTSALSLIEPGTPQLATGQNLQNNINKTLSVAFTNGTAASQIDTIYALSGNFTASTAKVIHLGNGSVSDAYSNPVSMVHLTTLYFANLATTDTSANQVTVGTASNGITTLFPSTSTVIIPAGGSILINAGLTGYLVTSGTADAITFTPSTGTPAFELIALGRSA